MEDKHGRPIIVIANRPRKDYMESVAIEGMKGKYEIVLYYTNANKGQVEVFLQLMRQCAWFEKEGDGRGITTTDNLVCVYKNKEGMCTNPNLSKKPPRCIEIVRKNCSYYEKRYLNPMHVNWVIIEQAPAVRDLIR
jgi:hypothetical protein